MNYKIFLIFVLGFLGIFLFNEFTGKQVVRLDVAAADACPIQVNQASPCDASKVASDSYTAAESRDRDVICSLAEAKAKLSCKDLNCPESCPAIFEKKNELFGENTCYVDGDCKCKSQEIEQELPEETTCQDICTFPTEPCQPLILDLSPRVAQKLVGVSEAYKRGGGEGDKELSDLLRSSACALGLQYAPMSLRNAADRVREYTSFEVCGAELELQPDFSQFRNFLSNPQTPSLKGIAKIADGLTAEVRVDPDGNYRAELNLDLCKFIRKK